MAALHLPLGSSQRHRILAVTIFNFLPKFFVIPTVYLVTQSDFPVLSDVSFLAVKRGTKRGMWGGVVGGAQQTICRVRFGRVDGQASTAMVHFSGRPPKRDR